MHTIFKTILAAFIIALGTSVIYAYTTTTTPKTDEVSAATLAISQTQSQPQTVPTTPHITISFDFTRQHKPSGDQFALWVENDMGQIMKQLFVTKDATTLQGKQDLNTLPLWAGKVRNHTPQAVVEATAGTTPENGPVRYFWDLTNKKGQPVPDGTYTIYIAATQSASEQLNWRSTVTVKNGQASIVSQPTAIGKLPNNTMIADLAVTTK